MVVIIDSDFTGVTIEEINDTVINPKIYTQASHLQGHIGSNYRSSLI